MARKLFYLRGIVFAVVLVCIFMISVDSFGVASNFGKDNPLAMSPGERKTAELYLQNMVGDEDVTIRAVMKDDQGIASIKGGNIVVKAHTKDTVFPVDIVIPQNITSGTKYRVVLNFVSVPASGDGMVNLALGFDTPVDVLVVAPTPSLSPETGISNKVYAIIGIAVLVLAIVVWFILRKKKK